MKARNQTWRAKSRRRRHVGVSRIRAAAIARARVNRVMVECEASSRASAFFRPNCGRYGTVGTCIAVRGWPHLPAALRREFGQRIGTLTWQRIAAEWPALRNLSELSDLGSLLN